MDWFNKQVEIKSLPVAPLTQGSKGADVLLLQEWLNIYARSKNVSCKVDTDSVFGPKTAIAVKNLKSYLGLMRNPVIDADSWDVIVSPMVDSFTSDLNSNYSFSELLVQQMMLFMNAHPVEIGNNKGPWVRAFMKGKDGDWAAWCMGAVSTALNLVCDFMDYDQDSEVMPWTWSTVKCKEYAKSGDYPLDFYEKNDVKNDSFKAEPGDLFLVEKNNGMPRHVGVVVSQHGRKIITIEGNTNDEGSREGYELVQRTRYLSSGLSIVRITI